MKRHSTILAVALAAFLLAIAAYRAAPYLSSKNSNGNSQQRKMVVKSLSNIDVPIHDLSDLSKGIDDLGELVGREVYRSLLKIEAPHRPAEVDAKAIADVFVRYFKVNRATSLDEALATYPARGIEPGFALTQADRGRAKNAWALSTVWARHADLDAQNITALPLFRAGTRVLNPATPGRSYESRELASGGTLSLNEHRYSAYAILVRAKVPSLDGSRELDVSIGFAIVNDRPRAQWDVAEVYWVSDPGDDHLLLPFP